MRIRALGPVAGILLVGVLALGGVGVAMAQGWMGPGWGPHPVTSQGTYGPGGMMSSQEPGGMMEGYGPGGMMGSSQYPPTQQGTSVTGVTQVTMQDFAFQPANIQVPVGTTATWTNQDTAPHTVTFRSGVEGSDLLQRRQSFRYAFTAPGAFDFYCAVHPNMLGRVTVTS